MDPAKLKVIELRSELSKRGLDTKGNKAVLVERLRQALDDESGNEPSEQVESSPEPEDVREKTPEPPKPAKTPARPMRSTRHQEQAQESQDSPVPRTPTRGGTRSSARAVTPDKKPPVKSPVVEKVHELPTITETPGEEGSPQKETTKKVSKKQEATAAESTEKPIVSPEKQEAHVSPAKVSQEEKSSAKPAQELKSSPAKVSQDVKTSPVKVSEEVKSPAKLLPEVKTSPVKVSQELKESPVKVSQEVKPSPAQIIASPVKCTEPAKPLQESPAKSAAQSPAKIAPVAQTSPVKSQPSPVKPQSSPVKPQSSPVKPQSSPVKPQQSPVKSVQESPVKSEQVPASPVKSATSPVKSSPTKPVTSPSKSPAKSAEPEQQASLTEQETSQSEAKNVRDNVIDFTEDIEMKDDEEDPGCYAHLVANEEEMKNFEEELKNFDLEMDSSDKYDHETKDKDEGGEKKDESKDDSVKQERKRKRSPSPDDEAAKAFTPRAEEEPELEASAVALSWYDSDLNLIIKKEGFFSATPMHNDGFGYVWAGARATYGFRTGKIFYEVKITENCPITLQDEENPHLLRVGWSVIGSSMQLGEEPLSFGYDGTGKKSTNSEFSDYGESFGKNDVVGCYLDMSSDNVEISYTVNGNSSGPAFTIPKTDLGDKALYPHILTKNCTFECNFGQEDSWSSTILDDYVYVGKVDVNDRVIGPQRPEKREDCEMVMLCGLPGSGKTFWSIKYAAENPDKMYNILGTNALIDKMKVMGLPRKESHQGKWEVVIDKCSRALTKLVDVAARRRRNYILDQNNVYLTAQKRKMRHFQGFQRKAIVIVPSEEEYQTRSTKPEYVEFKASESTIQEMKANFVAPTVGESFSAVEYVELGEEEAKNLIEKYNKEAKEAGFGQQHEKKRSRFEKSDHRDGRSNRDARDRDNRRSGYSDRNRNSSWRGGGGGSSGGGWRDRNQRGGHMRYGGPNNWRGRGGPGGSQHNRGDRRGGNDRRPSNDRNRSSSRPGGWGQSGYQGSQSSGNWGGQQGNWSGGQQSGWNQGGNNWGGGQQWGGNWKGYGQGSYGQSGYGSSNYGNGNWGSWNSQQQYYNQYWGQNQHSGQTTTASGQATNSSSVTSSSTKNTDKTY